MESIGAVVGPAVALVIAGTWGLRPVFLAITPMSDSPARTIRALRRGGTTAAEEAAGRS